MDVSSVSSLTSSNIVISPTSTTPSPHPDTFIRICLLWTALHRTTNIPSACQGVLTQEHMVALQSRHEFGKLLNSLESSGQGKPYLKDDLLESPINNNVQPRDHNHVKYQFRYTSRSLSVIGVLGGIVLILLIVAMSTCIKGRRNMILEQQTASGHDSFARQILIDHIRHISSNRRRTNRANANDRPPSYDDVVKTKQNDEDELPSYIEAMEVTNSQQLEHPLQIAEEVEQGEAVGGDRSHVVTIEVNNDDNTMTNESSDNPSRSENKSENA